MDKSDDTRREFLRSAAWSCAALATPVRLSLAGAPSQRTFTFVQLCDTQLGFGGYQHDVSTFRQAVRQINAMAPDFVVICGDLVNQPDETAYADFKKIKGELIVPCYCACGNHDVGSKPTPESLQYYRNVMGKDYYSFEHKGYVFVMVNTQLWKGLVEGESNQHESWLKSTLETAAQKRSPIFVVGHYPLFLKNPDEAEEYMNLPLATRKALLSLFAKRGVVAVLGGHTHRLVINEYKGMQLVNGETTSKNFDKRPFGFRVWHVARGKSPAHEFVSLEGR